MLPLLHLGVYPYTLKYLTMYCNIKKSGINVQREYTCNLFPLKEDNLMTVIVMSDK